ncbi:hypothetical protein J3458_005638 [Metarhizium acridum]|uniref:uncharacterized protein n=1 Tax=Metarhizium acridum TaxID=92637 RepID=UPI001C6B14B1|nr:hypothetical protein J3458_005638 [Metarhizium acridum]
MLHLLQPRPLRDVPFKGQLFIPISASVNPALIHMPSSTIRNGPCRDRVIRGSDGLDRLKQHGDQMHLCTPQSHFHNNYLSSSRYQMKPTHRDKSARRFYGPQSM